jgi:site-specific DNA-methyltransferase (adenine-specific)
MTLRVFGGAHEMVSNVICGDCLEILPTLPPRSVDLVFGSPPYEDCRTYGIDFKLKGQAWVGWMVEVFRASLRVSKGLVAFVVEGKTRKFRWSATPALLMADLHRAGITLRKPPIYERDGIPGSGGPDWWKNRYEFIVCATNGGRLPWSDNTACGHPPIYGPGGVPSHRMADGSRVNGKVQTRRKSDGSRPRDGIYKPPDKANPGNIVDCGACGGGHLGSKLAHENEAPFPESLVEPFVKSFCPPGGIVLDPFGGSGTVAAVAEKHGRNWISIDLRPSQAELTTRRICEVHGIPPIPTTK